MIEYWFRLLIEGGVGPILVNTHHLAGQVEEYIHHSTYSAHVHLVHEEVLLGTGGTLLRNRDFFGNAPMMLIHGDNLSLFDIHAFESAYFQKPVGVDITMMTFTTPTPESCGIVVIDGNGVVREFHEKVPSPPGNRANAAVYILSPVVIDYLASLNRAQIDFSTDVLPNYIGRINTFHNDVYHRDIGTLESLSAARQEYSIIEKACRNR